MEKPLQKFWVEAWPWQVSCWPAKPQTSRVRSRGQFLYAEDSTAAALQAAKKWGIPLQDIGWDEKASCWKNVPNPGPPCIIRVQLSPS